MRPGILVVALLIATAGSADQFIPPVPKRIGGETVLQNRGPIPLPSPKHRWVRVESRHFQIISSASERRAREICEVLEAMANALHRVDPRLATPTTRTRVFLFTNRAESQRYFDLLLNRDNARTPGLFVAHGDGSGTMIIDAAQTFVARTVTHELIHNLLASSGARLPLWLEEGLAEYFSSADVQGSVIRIGRPIREHQMQLRLRRLHPLSEVFAATHDNPISEQPLFYAQSWAVVDWLMRSRRTAFYDFVADIEKGTETGLAMKQRFGIDPMTMERQLKRGNVRPPSAQTVRLDPTKETIRSEPITDAAAWCELGTFLGLFEAARVDAEHHLLEARREEPALGRAVSGLATLRMRERKEAEALPLFEEALQISPEDPVVQIEAAEALMSYGLGPFAGIMDLDAAATARFRRAREHARKSMEHGGDVGRAEAVIGTTYLVEDPVTDGVPYLQRARRVMPARRDVAVNLLALLLRSGQQSSAAALYEETFARARDPQWMLAGKAVMVRERLVKANRFLRQGQLDDAAAIVSELIQMTSDQQARADLEGQLLKIRDTAEVNRQISLYNEAVAAFNRGDDRAALEILSRVLAQAKDERLLSDARELEAEARRRGKGMRRAANAL